MFNNDYNDLIKILRIPSHERTDEEHDYLFAFLRSIDELKHYRENLLKSIAWIIRHEEYPVPNTVIYSFGRRIGRDTYRREDCICLEACDLLVIDTPDLEQRPVVALDRVYNPSGIVSPSNPTSGAVAAVGGVPSLAGLDPRAAAMMQQQQQYPKLLNHQETLLARLSDSSVAKRMSHSSDTSSAYSGSGELDSSVQNYDSDEELHQQMRMLDADSAHGVQVTPDLPRRSPLLIALEKDPTERSNEDIELLLDSFQRLHAFSNFTRATQRQFAGCMLYAVVEKPGQVVLDDGEKLDSWSVIVDGEVEIQRPGNAPVQLHCGDAFGVKPTTERQHHVGVMRSLVPNCRFAFITQEQYCKVLSAEAENTIEIRASDGSLQLVKEIRTLESGTLKKQQTIIRGTPQALIDQLLECRGGSSADPNYADDFLLTYRTFLDSGLPVAQRLLEGLGCGGEQASRAVRVFLLWTNNHFNDFDDSSELFRILQHFDRQLERREETRGPQNLLRIACSTKSRLRKAACPVVNSGARFHLGERLCYVRDVIDSSPAALCGLRSGDRVVSIGGQPVEQMPLVRLKSLLQPSHQQQSDAKLDLTVRWDPLNFYKLLLASNASATAAGGGHQDSGNGGSSSSGGGSLGRATGRQLVPGKAGSDTGAAEKVAASAAGTSGGHALKGSTSNPDLSAGIGSVSGVADQPDHVIRVFRPDGAFKLLCINQETTAREVVMLSMQEFGLHGSSNEYKLMEISVNAGPLIRRKTLSDNLQDLGNRLALNARYYVKQQNELAHQFLSDADAQDVLREAAVDFLQLDPQEVAMRITTEDFNVFQRILPTHLVDWWHRKEKASKEINELSAVTEKESNWPVSELTAEQNTNRRVRLLKHFLKVAQYCRQLNNLNTLMSLTLGLAKSQNSQLNPAWEKLPKKYRDIWKSLEKLTDIRMNHSSYRQLFKSDKFQAPAIPYLPILCKDLTAIRECNEQMKDGLVNFEKLRLLAREVRGFCHYAQASYEGHTWRQGGHHQGSASASTAATLHLAGAPNASVPPPLRRAGSSSALTVGSGSGKRRSAAVAALTKKLHDETIAEKKLAEYVSRLRLTSAESDGGPISQCPDVASTAGTKFNTTNDAQFNKLMSLSEGRKPAKHQHIPAAVPAAVVAGAAAPAARPPLPPPYQQVMQQRQHLSGVQQLPASPSPSSSSSSVASPAPPPPPPPRSETTVATVGRPLAPPPYHQAQANVFGSLIML
uniref:Rap guanine nucleotide exchange factor 2 n=1 Tax=Macrostomum lignano TaxID=282301 RepID=A0A1I8FTV7_9PLAT